MPRCQGLPFVSTRVAFLVSDKYFAASAQLNKQPIGMMWDAQLFELEGWVIPKGAPNLEEVYKFVKFATDTQRLADQAKYISYGPARKSSASLVGKHAELGVDMGPHMPTHPANAKNVLLKQNIELFELWACSLKNKVY